MMNNAILILHEFSNRPILFADLVRWTPKTGPLGMLN
jgi:hypothetical protein